MLKVILASANQHKADELNFICRNKIEFVTMRSAGILDDIEETGTTFSENALLKARFVYERTGLPVLSDDSGLEVSALNGEPGVYSARYAGPEKNDQENTRKLLRELENSTDRSANFKTVLVYKSELEEKVFEGVVYGKIALAPKGVSGFGYDPIFIPNGFKETFGELSPEVKNKLSHRFHAVNAFLKYMSIL